MTDQPDLGDGTAPPEENFWDDRTTPHWQGTPPMTNHLAHTHDPDTSHDAIPAAEQRSRVKQAILYLMRNATGTAGAVGLTSFEARDLYFQVRESMSWPVVQPHSIARRMSELHVAGLIHDTGHRRLSPDGKGAAVWAVTE